MSEETPQSINPIVARIQALLDQQNAANAPEQERLAREIKEDAERGRKALERRRAAEAAAFSADPESHVDQIMRPEKQQFFVPRDEEEEEAQDFVDTLPACRAKRHEFLIELDTAYGAVIFCVRELPWPLALEIETQAYRMNTHQKTYFSGEYERRETLRNAIQWVAIIAQEEFVDNDDGMILSKLHQDLVEALWPKYQAIVEMSGEEAVALYNSAISYFRSGNQQGKPTAPIILEVDMLTKFGGLSRKELRNISKSEMERIQLVFMARSEALGIVNSEQQYRGRTSDSTEAEQKIQDTVNGLGAQDESLLGAFGGNFFPPGHGPNG